MAQAADVSVSERLTTPTTEGPAANVALLGTGNGASDVSSHGVAFTLDALAQYRTELEQVATELRERGRSLVEQVPQLITETNEQLQPRAMSLVDSVTDTSNIAVPLRPTSETMAYGSILLGIATLASILGAYVVSPLIQPFVLRCGAGAIAIGLSALAARRLQQKTENASDAEIRIELAYLAGLQGLLSGYATSRSYLTAQPATFMAPLVAALVLPLVARQGRTITLGAIVAASLGVNLFVGQVAGLASLSYVGLSLVYTAITAATFQLVVKESSDARSNTYTLLLLAATLTAKTLIFGVFGNDGLHN